MSRIGKRLIIIPDDVQVSIDGNTFIVNGPLGTLKMIISKHSKIEIKDKTITVKKQNSTKNAQQMFGTTNALISNMIKGVKEPFIKELEIIGVGYKAQLQGDKISLSLGFSHPVIMDIPSNVKVEIPKPTFIKLSSIDKQLVGQFAAEIRNWRKPEPYKGKGIKYIDEHIVRKVGKTADSGKK